MRIYKGNIRMLLQENVSQDTFDMLESWHTLFIKKLDMEYDSKEYQQYELELQLRTAEVAIHVYQQCHDAFMKNTDVMTKQQFTLCRYIDLANTGIRKTFNCHIGKTFYLYTGEYLHEICEERDTVYTLLNLPEHIQRNVEIYHNFIVNIARIGLEVVSTWRILRVMQFLEKGDSLSARYETRWTLDTIYTMLNSCNVKDDEEYED